MIGSWNEPRVRTVKTGIPTLDIHTPNFKTNTGLLNAVHNSRFNGLPSENPFDHIDRFECVCAMYREKDVSLETTRMMFFPFSLDALARKWERSTPSELLSDWDDIKEEFLSAFSLRHRTEKVRADIINFQQGNAKLFSKAWARFEGFTQDSPHHGFEKGALLSMFYRGCTPRNRELMDASSEGSFKGNTVLKGWRIVSKIARNDDSYELHRERERSPLRTRFESVQFLHDEEYQDINLEINYVNSKQTLSNGQTEQQAELYEAEGLDSERNELKAEMNEVKEMMKAFMVTQRTCRARMHQKIKELEARVNERMDEISDSFTTLVARAKFVQEKLNFNVSSIDPNEDECLYLIDDEMTVEPVSDEEAPGLDEQLSADNIINNAESNAYHGTDLKSELQTHEIETASQLSGLTISTSRRVPKIYQPRWSWEKSKLEDDAFRKDNQAMKTMAKIDKLYLTRKKCRERLKVWDEAGPRNGKTRTQITHERSAGTSKTSSSKDKGKGKMPDISEIDPEDKPNANPDDFPFA